MTGHQTEPGGKLSPAGELRAVAHHRCDRAGFCWPHLPAQPVQCGHVVILVAPHGPS